MKCIYCGFEDSKVVDSRSTVETNSIRRRRECLNCGKRFTTYETVESTPVLVVKKNGSIQPFDKNKIINGVIKACEKRPVSLAQIEGIADDIEKELNDGLVKEIRSIKIGDMVMERLKPLDDVAYIRFASVYRQFKDVTNFINFLSDIEND
ncbi:MAG: transcriptional repressor NrdR [Clostridiales bacterium]|nr:transcriptional repressor NrdR [Clostridiales bacterium]